MNIFRKKPNVAQLPVETKVSAVGYLISSILGNSTIHRPKDYLSYAKEGYGDNVIVFRCINEIANAISSIEWYVRNQAGSELKNHDAMRLLRNPNATQSWGDFIKDVVSYYFIAGNSYVEAQTGENARLTNPSELWCLRPDRMQIVNGEFGIPRAYEYCNGSTYRFAVDQLTGFSKVHHWKRFNPTDDFYGMSPIEAASFVIDQHNAGSIYNAALLQNGAQPSAIASIKSDTSENGLMALKAAIDEKYSGVANAGKVIVTSAELSWQPIATHSRDMQLTENMREAAQSICIALGVPIELILPVGTTYSNKAEARSIFWENTIIPLVKQMRDGMLNGWLAKFYPKDKLEFYYDENDIVALMPQRAAYQDRVLMLYDRGLITVNEAREEFNLSAIKVAPAIAPEAKSRAIETKNSLENIENLIDRPAVVADNVAETKQILELLVMQFGQAFIDDAGLTMQMLNDAALTSYVKNRSAEMVTQINTTTKSLLKDVISQSLQANEGIDALKSSIEALFTDFAPWRAQMIATTEVTQAIGTSSLAAAKQAGIKNIEWLAVIDGATRDTHSAIDGTVVRVGSDFRLNDGDKGKTTGKFGKASNNINCRCAIAASFSEVTQRTYDQRRILWKKQDVMRKKAEATFATAFVAIFEKQKNIILKGIGNG